MFKLTDYISRAELETFCRRHHITRMSLFGSALRDELEPGSDIDILVEFDKDHMPGLFDIAGIGGCQGSCHLNMHFFILLV